MSSFDTRLAEANLPEEVKQTLKGIISSSDFLEASKESFADYDTDKNGHIDKHELKAALQAMYESIEENCHPDRITDELLETTFKEFDANGDGKLEFHEYLEYCKVMTLKLFSLS